jgi:hypothetical protein
MIELRHYDGFLSLGHVPPERLAAMKEVVDRIGLKVDLCETYVDFEYEGRDTGRWVVRLLLELAPLMEGADGEITCSWYDDERENPGDQEFEFYTIAGGRLHRQAGTIVRGPREPVDSVPEDVRPPSAPRDH